MSPNVPQSQVAGIDSQAAALISLSLVNANFANVHLVVRLIWEVVPIANKVAEILGVVAQHVAYLTTSIRSVLSSLDPSIGCLLRKKNFWSSE